MEGAVHSYQKEITIWLAGLLSTDGTVGYQPKYSVKYKIFSKESTLWFAVPPQGYFGINRIYEGEGGGASPVRAVHEINERMKG